MSKKHLGEIRCSKGAQCLGSGSKHPDGGTYSVHKDLAIALVDADFVLEKLGQYIDLPTIPATGRKVKLGEWELLKKTDLSDIERTSLVMQIFNRHRSELKGKSKQEACDWILDYIARNNEHKEYRPEIWRDRTEKYISKYFDKPNPVKFEKTGDGTKQKKDVPTLSFVDFSEFEAIFENTHKHLHAFDLIDAELGLNGKEYYAAKKHLCYDVESQRQETITFSVGRDFFDNRVHNITCAGGGKGKGQFKRIHKMAQSQAEISAARTNIEQLVGKRKKQKGGKEIEDRSIFGEKKLLIDEGQCLLCEEDRGSAALMHDIRIAVDTFGFNQVEKKQVDTNWLRYCPETRVSFYIHDIILPPVFFDLGSFRRFFAFELRPQKVKEGAAVANLYAESKSNEMREYIKTPALGITRLDFEPKAIDTVAKAIKVWNRFSIQHPNQRVRAIAKQGFFSIKQYFFRTVAILAISNAKNRVDVEMAELGCFDAIHFLLETFKFYANHSKVVLSRDIWKSSDMREAMLFEWLHYNRATSKESKLSISDVQEEIQDVFGINERQARSIFQRLKKEGFLDSERGFQESRAWLAFEPSLDGFIEFSEEHLPSLKKYLLELRINHFGNNGNEGELNFTSNSGNTGSVDPPHPTIHKHAESPPSSSFFVISKKGDTPQKLPKLPEWRKGVD